MEEQIDNILDSYFENDKTILLVDNTGSEESLEYFLNSSKFRVLECKNLHTKRLVHQHTVYPIIEEARFALVYAMKYGKTLVMRMADCTADFVSAMCDENCRDRETENPYPPHQPWQTLPRGFMLSNGKIPRENPDGFLRRPDMREIKDGDCDKVHRNFKVIVTTILSAEKVEEMLLNGRYGLPGTAEDYNIIVLR